MSKEQTGGAFADLLKAITEADTDADALVKAIPDTAVASAADDQTIQAAAVDSDDDKEKIKDADGKPEFAKSMTVTGADGEAVEVIDATEILKSLQGTVGEHGDLLAKALPGLVSTIQKQGNLIKSLQESMTKLAGQGAGRKAMVVAIDKPEVGTMAKSQAASDGQLSQEEFFAKADSAYEAGKISGHERNTIDVCRRMQQPIDPGLIRKVALS